MKKLVIYFHGYNSSPNTDKVARLCKESSFLTYAFPIHLDPSVAYPELVSKIDDVLMNFHNNENIKLVFVGTSLGGWWASKLAKEYGCKSIIINPSSEPANSLRKYDVPERICTQYEDISFPDNATYFFAKNDGLLDHTELIRMLTEQKKDVRIYKDGGHRFNGASFEKVVDYIKEI